MSNQYSARPIDSSDSDSDRMRTLLDNLNNLKSKLHHFTVIDELGQPIGEITDLILDAGHQLNLVIALAEARSDAGAVLLNGRRIKKVSVQTQSVFVDITKADTQFLPEYSAEATSSLEASTQPLPAAAASFPDLTFSDEPSRSEHVALNDEHPTQPTAADLELAQSLFTTEPEDAIAADTPFSSQDWELPNQHQAEDVFADWNGPADTTSSFSVDSEPAPESLANELERLDLQLDHDWSELETVSETAETSHSFELNLDLEPLSQEPPAFDLSEVDDLFAAEPLAAAEPANPFAGALPDFGEDAISPADEELANLDWSDGTSEAGSTDFITPAAEQLPDLNWSDGTSEESPVDVTPDFNPIEAPEELPDLDWNNSPADIESSDFITAAVDELPNLDWTETATDPEPPDFTLESADFAFDLPASETSTDSENAFLASSELEPEPLSEPLDLGLENLDFSLDSSPEPSESGVEPDFSEPDTISSLADLDLGADHPTLEAATPTFDALLEQPSDHLADSSLNLESVDFQSDRPDHPSEMIDSAWDLAPTEEPSNLTPNVAQDDLPPEAPVVQEPEDHDIGLAAAGAGAVGLVAGLASSSLTQHQAPPTSPPAEMVSAPAQPAEPLDAELPLLEEQLNVEYQRRKVGEVIIRKQIETRMVQVPVRYEKLIIEQVSPERKSLAEVDLSQGALDNIELTGANEKPTVAGEFTSPAVASQALDAIAKALQNRCKRVRIEIELEDGQMQQAYQEWFDQCSQL